MVAHTQKHSLTHSSSQYYVLLFVGLSALVAVPLNTMEMLEVMEVKGMAYAVCQGAFSIGLISVSEYVWCTDE